MDTIQGCRPLQRRSGGGHQPHRAACATAAIEADSLPELGRALLQLEQGDSVQAVAALEQVAAQICRPQREGRS